MKKAIFVGLFSVLLLPSIASAAWWNPLSWFSFLYDKPKTVYVQPAAVIGSIPVKVETATSTNETAQGVTAPVATTTKKVATKIVTKPAPIKVVTPRPVQATVAVNTSSPTTTVSKPASSTPVVLPEEPKPNRPKSAIKTIGLGSDFPSFTFDPLSCSGSERTVIVSAKGGITSWKGAHLSFYGTRPDDTFFSHGSNVLYADFPYTYKTKDVGLIKTSIRVFDRSDNVIGVGGEELYLEPCN